MCIPGSGRQLKVELVGSKLRAFCVLVHHLRERQLGVPTCVSELVCVYMWVCVYVCACVSTKKRQVPHKLV